MLVKSQWESLFRKIVSEQRYKKFHFFFQRFNVFLIFCKHAITNYYWYLLRFRKCGISVISTQCYVIDYERQTLASRVTQVRVREKFSRKIKKLWESDPSCERQVTKHLHYRDRLCGDSDDNGWWRYSLHKYILFRRYFATVTKCPIESSKTIPMIHIASTLTIRWETATWPMWVQITAIKVKYIVIKYCQFCSYVIQLFGNVMYYNVLYSYIFNIFKPIAYIEAD